MINKESDVSRDIQHRQSDDHRADLAFRNSLDACTCSWQCRDRRRLSRVNHRKGDS
jgi:hypothetical protein